MRTLKLALRTLVHYRLYSIINLLGLALSLTCVVIIARYVRSELTVDGFNTKLDRIYLTTLEESNNPGNLRFYGIDNLSGDNIVKHPGVEHHSSFITLGDDDFVVGEQSYSAKMLVTDTAFLQILDYPTTGATNIHRPEDAFVSEAFAAKVFGADENPVGRTLYYPTVSRMLTVVGVIRPSANKSILSFEVLVSSQLAKNWGRATQRLILLNPQVDFREVNRQYGEFTKDGYRFQLFPYRDVYFDHSIMDFGGFPHGNITYVFILSSIGFLLLLTGLMNYINIHSVVMMRRKREFGMKKVFGAGSYRILTQIIVENMLLIVGALLVAFWLAEVSRPLVENTFDIRQYPNLRFDLLLALTLLTIIPVSVSVAPFLRYRYFSPLRSLRSINDGSKSLFTRKFFIAFQYFMTMGLIVVSIFFAKQLNFMLDKDLGFRTRDIISVPFLKSMQTYYFTKSRDEQQAIYEKNEAIANDLTQRLNASPLLERWSFGRFPVNSTNSTFEFKSPGGELQKTLILFVDETWVKMFDIRLLDGRLLNDEIDELSYNLIVTESTLKHFGFDDYSSAELQPYTRVWWTSGRDEEMRTNPPYRIVGVVEDFHIKHLSQQLMPTIIHSSGTYNLDPVIASFAPENRQKVIDLMKNLHDELVGGEFTYSFIEDEIAKLYGEDRKVAIICSAFTGIAIVISMLGLLGISLFDIRQRRKEIAIRKINGAEVPDILRLLMRKYFVLLGIAFVVATPASLFAIYKYLENFAYKAPISWWLFAIALFTTIAVSLATLIYQTYKAGNENPATVIKSEL